MSKLYHVRYVHKIAPRDSDVTEVTLPDTAFADPKTLARELRKAGIFSSGVRIRSMRVEGNRTILFPTCPGLTTYWHSVTLTPND